MSSGVPITLNIIDLHIKKILQLIINGMREVINFLVIHIW